MTTQPLISIVTPVKNGGKYIRTAIESVLNQDYPRIEHIVIDGLSSDNTVDILKEYDHLRWVSEEDRGGVEAVNKGLKLASGDMIGMVCADDFYEPNIFGAVVEGFKKNPDWKWLSGYGKIVNTDGNEIRRPLKWYKNFFLRHHSFKLLLTECYISGHTVFFKKELLEEFGYFEPRIPTEYLLWLKFASKYKMGVLNREIANFRLHQESITYSKYKKQTKIGLQAAMDQGRRYPLLIFLRTINHYKTLFVYSILNRNNGGK